MAEANENATDTASLKRTRRSSIRKSGRPPFDEVDTNITGDVTGRRPPKRVSFSDTHQVKVFDREQSAELSSSSTDKAADPAVSGALVPTVDNNATRSEEADQLPQFECSAHEQSFYQGEEGEGSDCSPCKKISPLEDALSCLMVGRRGPPNRTSLGQKDMDLTGPASPQLHLNRTTLAPEGMDLTRAAISTLDDTVEPTRTCGNITTYGPNSMNLTCMMTEESLCGDKVPTGEGWALGNVVQMLSREKSHGLSWWGESPGRRGAVVGGGASPTFAKAIEAHDGVGACEAEQAARGTPTAERTLSGTDLGPASTRSRQMNLATQLAALDLYPAEGKEGVAVVKASSAGALETAESEPFSSQAPVSAAGGSSPHCPPLDAALAADDAGTLEIDSSKANPLVFKGVGSELGNHDCGGVVDVNEAPFGITQHVSAMMDMTCASSRPVLAVDGTVADRADQGLSSSTLAPLDGMEMTGGVTGPLECQMSMTCANLTSPTSNLLDAACPSVEPVLEGGSSNMASQDCGEVVNLNRASFGKTQYVSAMMDMTCASSRPAFAMNDGTGADHTDQGLASSTVMPLDDMEVTGKLTKTAHCQMSATWADMTNPASGLLDATCPSGKLDVKLSAGTVTAAGVSEDLGWGIGTVSDTANATQGVEENVSSSSIEDPRFCRADSLALQNITAGHPSNADLTGVLHVSRRESVTALQLLVSPANKRVTRARTPNRSSNTGLSPSFNCRSASLKKSFGKVHKAFRDVLNSAEKVPPGLDVSALLGTPVSSIGSVPAGLDVSAFLATSARSICSSTALDDVFSPARQNAQEMNSLHSSAVGASERSAGTSQQKRRLSFSEVGEGHCGTAKTMSDLDTTQAETAVKSPQCVDAVPMKGSIDSKDTSGAVESHLRDAARVSSTFDKVHPTKRTLATKVVRASNDQDATLPNQSTCDNIAVSEPQRKSATFVVNVGRNRNSAASVLDSKGRPSATFVRDAEMRPSATFTVASTESGAPCSPHTSTADAVAEEPLLTASGIHRDRTGTASGSGILSTVAPRSRKKLQFADPTGESTHEHIGNHGGVNVDRSRVAALTSATKPRQLSDRNGSSDAQRPLGNRFSTADEETLMDVEEPTLISSSCDKSPQQSLPACPGESTNFGRQEAASLPTEQQDRRGAEDSSACAERVLLETSPISTSTFYAASSSSSTRKKLKVSPPSPPRTRSSQKGASASRGQSSKRAQRRRLPATTATASKRRKGSNTAPSSRRKGTNTSRRAGRARAGRAASESSDESFSYGVKLESVPTTPEEKMGSSEVTQAHQRPPNDIGSSTAATREPAPMEFEEEGDPRKELFDVDPELDLTSGIDIEGILERLDDANVQESLYWSVHQLPRAMLEDWELRTCEELPHKAVFTFAGDLLELTVAIGDSVEQPAARTQQAVQDAVSGKVRRRTKHLAAVRLRIYQKCKPFGRFVCRRLIQQYQAGELLRQQYPTTDRLGELLSEVGGHFVRLRPLRDDISQATRSGKKRRWYAYTFSEDSVLSIEVSQPRKLVWFHMDLPIDLGSYPHAEILPSARPYLGPVGDPGDEYISIRTEKLRRITARVAPGPQYLTRMVDELDAFMKR